MSAGARVLIRWLCLGLLGLFSLSCGGSSEFMRPVNPKQATVADPAAATVVFIRPSGYGGAQENTIVDSKGRFLGESWGETYFVTKVPPGEHLFIAWSEGTPALRATVEAGKIYYVEIGLTMGVWSGRARLFGIGPQRQQWAELKEWLANSEMLAVDEAKGQAHLATRQEDLREVLQKGQASWNEYDEEARLERSLTPADGVTTPM